MGMEHMNYCMECGTKLKMKPLKGEGEVPYCEHCGTFRFPVFSTACSMIVMNPEETKILLIKQYGRDDYILVAGYVNKGEDAEAAAEGVTEELKSRDQMEWVRRMNSIRNRAEEMVKIDLIYK